MKKFILMVAICVATSGVCLAQSVKERQEMVNSTKAELNEKATKAARKEAKSLKKEGWKVAPGALPLEKQLDRSYIMQYEFDEEMFPKYVMGEAMSTASDYDAAKMQALELAKQNLAAQIQVEVAALIDNKVANAQLGKGEAASVIESVMKSKSLISQSIGRVITVAEAYRELRNKNKEVLLRIAYSSSMAKKATLNAVKEELKQKGDALSEKLDELLGW